MVGEPDILVLRHLREIRADIQDFRTGTDKSFRGVQCVQNEHTLHLESLEERFELLREGTMNAIGFAANADRQYRVMKGDLAGLEKRVEKLEKAK